MKRVALCMVWFAATAVMFGCGGPEAGAADPPAVAAAATAAPFTGSLTVAPTSTTVGSPVVVTETASNQTGGQLGPLIVGIARAGFDVAAVQKPRTGTCRIAGSATCNFVQLAPGESQSYTLTLVPTTPGTYNITGWTRSSYLPGGTTSTVVVTVR